MNTRLAACHTFLRISVSSNLQTQVSDLSQLLDLESNKGVPINQETTELPCTKIVIYDIEVD